MSKLVKFFHGIFYMEQETIMTPEQKNYHAAAYYRDNLTKETILAIETRVERFCRFVMKLQWTIWGLNSYLFTTTHIVGKKML